MAFLRASISRNRTVIVTLLLAVLAAGACHRAKREVRRGSPSRGKAYDCQAHIPPNSSGVRPAGTKDDPFVGYGVVRAKNTLSPEFIELLALVRPIAYFRTGLEGWFVVRADAAAQVEEGDYFKMKFWKLPVDSELAIRAAAAEKSGIRPPLMPFVYCGYELFAVEHVADRDFPR